VQGDDQGVGAIVSAQFFQKVTDVNPHCFFAIWSWWAMSCVPIGGDEPKAA